MLFVYKTTFNAVPQDGIHVDQENLPQQVSK